MSATLAVARLELRRLAVRPFAWLLAALTLAELAWRFMVLLGNFLAAQVTLAGLPGGPGFTDLVAVPTLSSVLTGSLLPLGMAELALVVVPLLSMGSLAGERASGTLALLAGMGLAPSRIVLGKYLALLVWLGIWLALVLTMPLCLMDAAPLDLGKLAAAALGTACALAALAALGLACSAHAPHPAVAATLALVIGLALWTMDLAARAAGVDNGVLAWLAMSTHLENLLRGLVSSADLAWFALFVAICLTLAARRVAADKERD